jgi:hypothetical protein
VKRLALALGCVLALAPGVASAALSISFGPDITKPAGAIPSGELFFDLVFSETAPITNEGLFAYDLYLVRNMPGINLVRAEKPDNWVFTSPGASFQQAGPEFSHSPGLLVVNAIGELLGANQDIVNGTKAARVFYTIDPDAPCALYTISLDNSPGTTLFVSGDTGDAIPVDISDRGTVRCTPEPTSLLLPGVAGMLALRRLRPARACV